MNHAVHQKVYHANTNEKRKLIKGIQIGKKSGKAVPIHR